MKLAFKYLIILFVVLFSSKQVISNTILRSGSDVIVSLDKNTGEMKSSNFYISFGLISNFLGNNEVQLFIHGIRVPLDIKISKNGFCYFSNINDNEENFKPSQNDIKLMNLKEGHNEAKFLLKTLLISHYVTISVYVWDVNSKIIISDIDGTITKSDVLGQILPFIGVEWAHEGVTQMMSAINSNNYKIIYLTARPLFEYSITKKYITTLEQSKFEITQ
jgi:phosphatidate phosphatase LPIN